MLKEKLILSYASRIIVQFLQIASTIFVARIAGADVLGTIAFGLAYVGMFQFIGDLGVGTAVIKKLSEGVNDESSILGTFLWVKIVLIVLYVFTILGFYYYQKVIAGVVFETVYHEYVIYIFIIVNVLNLLVSIPTTIFAAFTQQAKTDLPNFIQTLLYQIFRIVVVLLGYKVIALAVSNLVALLIVIPIYLYLIKPYKFGKFDIDILKSFLKISIPVLLVGITSTLTSTLDKVLLQFYTNSTQVGLYTAGFRIGGFILLIANSIGLLFFPIFSKAAQAHDFKSIIRLISKFQRFSFIYIAPFILLLAFLSKDIVLFILGKNYIDSTPILIVINFAMFIRVLYSPYGSLIAGLGYFNKGLLYGVIGFVVFILSMIILVNPIFLNMSGFGASISIFISYFVMFVLYIISSKKHVPGIKHNELFKYSIFWIVISICSLLLFYLIGINNFESRIIFSVMFIIVSFSVMGVLKLFAISDLDYIKSIFNIRSINNYIRIEIKKNKK